MTCVSICCDPEKNQKNVGKIHAANECKNRKKKKHSYIIITINTWSNRRAIKHIVLFVSTPQILFHIRYHHPLVVDFQFIRRPTHEYMSQAAPSTPSIVLCSCVARALVRYIVLWSAGNRRDNEIANEINSDLFRCGIQNIFLFAHQQFSCLGQRAASSINMYWNSYYYERMCCVLFLLRFLVHTVKLCAKSCAEMSCCCWTIAMQMFKWRTENAKNSGTEWRMTKDSVGHVGRWNGWIFFKGLRMFMWLRKQTVYTFEASGRGISFVYINFISFNFEILQNLFL